MMSRDQALFLYGFDVTAFNRYIPFKRTLLGTELLATLNIGNYSCTEFMAEAKRAMEVADPLNTYTITLNRTVLSNTQNRMSILTSGSYLDVLFGSSTSAANSTRDLMGFAHSDQTGATSYTGYQNAGTILLPEFATWDYLGPDDYVTNDGVKSVSAAGIKETLVFAQMRFIQGQWKYITDFSGRTQLTEWRAFMKYATRQLKFEFTPSINEDPDQFYQVTLESTPADGNGLAYKLVQQRGEGLYRFYDTGVLKFRVIPT